MGSSKHCGKQFPNWDELWNHIIGAHYQNPPETDKCSACGEGFYVEVGHACPLIYGGSTTTGKGKGTASGGGGKDDDKGKGKGTASGGGSKDEDKGKGKGTASGGGSKDEDKGKGKGKA